MIASPEKLREELIAICEPILENKGFELVDLEIVSGKKRVVLRFFLDCFKQVGGITISDCVRMSRELEDIIDFEDFFIRPYVLEVSSPGLDRPLVKEKDFDRFAGNMVNIDTFTAGDRQQKFRGVLRGIENHLVVIEDDRGNELRIPHSSIKKARIKYQWD